MYETKKKRKIKETKKEKEEDESLGLLGPQPNTPLYKPYIWWIMRLHTYTIDKRQRYFSLIRKHGDF